MKAQEKFYVPTIAALLATLLTVTSCGRKNENKTNLYELALNGSAGTKIGGLVVTVSDPGLAINKDAITVKFSSDGFPVWDATPTGDPQSWRFVLLKKHRPFEFGTLFEIETTHVLDSNPTLESICDTSGNALPVGEFAISLTKRQ
jgi:hypothetical protein